MSGLPVDKPENPDKPPARSGLQTLTRVIRDAQDEDREKLPLQWSLIRRMFTYARPYRTTCIALACLVIVRSIQLPMIIMTIAAVIGGPIKRGDWPGTCEGAAAFFALVLFTAITFHFRQRLALQFGEALVHDLRIAIFSHLHDLKFGFFTRTKLGRIIGRVTSDVETVRSGMQDVLFVGIVQCGQMLVAALLMLWCDWLLFIVILALAPVIYWMNHYFHAAMSVVTRAQQESYSKVTATLAESVNGVRVTQGFVRQDVNSGLFRELIAEHSRNNTNVALTNALFVPLLESTSQVFIAILLLLGGWQALTHQTGIENIITFFFLAGMFFAPIQVLGNLYSMALTAMAGAERVFRLLDTKPEWQDTANALALEPMIGHVELRDLGFSYLSDRPVLHGVSFIAKPGQSIALVGPTGCGKSTIINLIAKFYLPTSGQLLIDGHDITTLDSDVLHRQMGIVTQNNMLFSGTVMDNIRLGRPGSSDEQVIQAARNLDTLEALSSLPNGLQAEVGERGNNVSLGQRQLICFTRAMLANPRILILDEATSSVDGPTELRLQRALSQLLQGRTSFIVAHRLSTIRHVDQVLVLEQGRIIERGTHRQLLEQGGAYAASYRQFAQGGTILSSAVQDDEENVEENDGKDIRNNIGKHDEV